MIKKIDILKFEESLLNRKKGGLGEAKNNPFRLLFSSKRPDQLERQPSHNPNRQDDKHDSKNQPQSDPEYEQQRKQYDPKHRKNTD